MAPEWLMKKNSEEPIVNELLKMVDLFGSFIDELLKMLDPMIHIEFTFVSKRVTKIFLIYIYIIVKNQYAKKNVNK